MPGASATTARSSASSTTGSRIPNGFTFTPGSGYSQPITYPSRGSVNVRGINSAGIVCGYLPSVTGFFYDGQSFTTYLVPGAAITTIPRASNDSGVFTCNYSAAMAGGIQLGYIKMTAATLPPSPSTTPPSPPPTASTTATRRSAPYSDGPPLFVVDHGWYRDSAHGTAHVYSDYPGSHMSHACGHQR